MDIPKWADSPDAGHPIEWSSAGGDESAYLSWDGAIGRLVPSWYVDAETLRAYLEEGGTVRTPFAFYRLVR